VRTCGNRYGELVRKDELLLVDEERTRGRNWCQFIVNPREELFTGLFILGSFCPKIPHVIMFHAIIMLIGICLIRLVAASPETCASSRVQ
jgi:hypothetical protein